MVLRVLRRIGIVFGAQHLRFSKVRLAALVGGMSTQAKGKGVGKRGKRWMPGDRARTNNQIPAD